MSTARITTRKRYAGRNVSARFLAVSMETLLSCTTADPSESTSIGKKMRRGSSRSTTARIPGKFFARQSRSNA